MNTTYFGVSGWSLDRCAFLSLRYDEDLGYKPREGESIVVVNLRDRQDPKNITLRQPLVTDNWLTGLWLSDGEGVGHIERVGLRPGVNFKSTGKGTLLKSREGKSLHPRKP